MQYGQLVVAVTAGLFGVTTASTLTPPVLPLIVRNPYLSTWLQDARNEPWNEWPMFYNTRPIGFSVLASVSDGNRSTVYPLLGRPHDSLDEHAHHYNISLPSYNGASYDASVTNLSYSIPAPAKPVEVTLSFLSPITPTSTLRQAIPASYLTVHVKGSTPIDIYIDVNGQWVTGDNDAKIVWSLEHTNITEGKKLRTFKVRRRDEVLFTEVNHRAEWGTLLFTGSHNARYEAGTSSKLRKHFAKKGELRNEVDSNFRKVMDEEPVFAFSQHFDLGDGSPNGKSTEDNALFTIAHVQNPVTQFASARGLTLMRPLWISYFHTEEALTAYHYTDFRHASALAANYSNQLARDAYKSGSTNYQDIVSLSARQVLGACSFAGTPDNPLIFLKEISSNGNCQTIDVIFPAFPFFLYTNPRWLAYLLEPLIEHMLSGQYPNKYAMHDLGAHFPNQTGHPDGNDEYMPVEECGNILIMGLALVNSLQHGGGHSAQSIWSVEGQPKDPNELQTLADGVSPFALPAELETRNSIPGLDDQWGGIAASHQARKWISRPYRLWKQWTGYLEEYSLEPENQLCTDDFAGWLRLQTNLALKGIVGIKAMSELAELVGEKHDAKYYRNISETYISKWEKFGMARDGGRAKLAYHWEGSWTTLYSLYADAVLCFHPNSEVASDESPITAKSARFRWLQQQLPFLDQAAASTKKSNFIPNHIYTNQSRWYSTVMQKFGLPLDSRHLYTKSDWEFEAAAVASRHTRKQILDRVAKWVNETVTDRPLTDLYKTETDGGFPQNMFFARPVVGGHFAFLTLERACGGAGAAAFDYEE